MKRAAARPRPPVDYSRDRSRWEKLILQAHEAVAEDAPEARRRLAADGLSARNVWTPPAPYPSGLLCLGFAHLAYAWGSQTDPALRASARETLIHAAGMADQVMRTVFAPAPVEALAAGETPACRLPYADH